LYKDETDHNRSRPQSKRSLGTTDEEAYPTAMPVAIKKYPFQKVADTIDESMSYEPGK
jgi:hypothetical protein